MIQKWQSFFDIISEKREDDLITFFKVISEDINEISQDIIFERIHNGYYSSKSREEAKSTLEEEHKHSIPQKKVDFQTDRLSNSRPPLRIIHFNDVYNIEEKDTEPVGSYSRFYTAIHSFDSYKPLILFSGDIFSPSKLSIFFEGEQMMPFIKKAGIHWAWVGNHDFDFGDEKLGDLILRSGFPWLLSNVKSAKTGETESNTHEFVVLEHEGYKIAIFGLAELEWLESLNWLDLTDLSVEHPNECAKRYVKMFKEDRDDIDFLIALTHMRTPRDVELIRQVPELDLILGGHDHVMVNHQLNNTLVRKSGTDFWEFTLINMSLYDRPSSEFTSLDNIIADGDGNEHEYGVVIKDISSLNKKHSTMITEFLAVKVTSEFERDLELHQEEQKFLKELDSKLEIPWGYTFTSLDAKFSKIRFEETNISNMVADLVWQEYKTDWTILNTGTYRTDDVMRAGIIKTGDIMTLLPMLDHIMVLKVTGEKLHKLLENGVNSYPEFQGKFPSISGIELEFDPSKPKGSRIDQHDIKVKGELLDYERIYLLSSKHFLVRGKDGYTDFEGWEVVVNEFDGKLLWNLVISKLKALEEKQEGAELDEIWTAIGNKNKELSPEILKDGKIVRFIGINPKLDGRIKVKNIS